MPNLPIKDQKPTNKEGRTHRIVSYVNAEELDHIDDYAAKSKMTRSEFIRHCATFTPLPDPQRYHYVDQLLKQLADLARLGNLLKLLQDDEAIVRYLMKGRDEISQTIDEINALKNEEIRPLLDKINGARKTPTSAKRKKFSHVIDQEGDPS